MAKARKSETSGTTLVPSKQESPRRRGDPVDAIIDGLLRRVARLEEELRIQGRPPAIAAQKDGWWINIHTDKTECSSISFFIGTDGNNAEPWMTWYSGQPTEIDVPIGYRNVWSLWVGGVANPRGKNAWFCMMYKGSGVKHFDFDVDENHKKDQGDTDGEC